MLGTTLSNVLSLYMHSLTTVVNVIVRITSLKITLQNIFLETLTMFWMPLSILVLQNIHGCAKNAISNLFNTLSGRIYRTSIYFDLSHLIFYINFIKSLSNILLA